ncbi:hypothetical protein [Neoroseomonas soli]|uniref:Uncharacterized protein n=1 Tax=Neoroseomonas soli TaxID=1081025 RepID=A0A9X9WWV2_9PROT|nr:hypothetical protein [Neoroseomonas soli]MBR0671631.1 hypothetical protein [Neoroseomonas soli]
MQIKVVVDGTLSETMEFPETILAAPEPRCLLSTRDLLHYVPEYLWSLLNDATKPRAEREGCAKRRIAERLMVGGQVTESTIHDDRYDLSVRTATGHGVGIGFYGRPLP